MGITNTRDWLLRTGDLGLCHRHTPLATYTMARHCIDFGVPGDFVECGVFAGVQVAAMARACLDAGDMRRRVHLFDSFEGIPAPGPEDAGAQELAGKSACSIELVRGYMKHWDIPESLLVYHPGWFDSTVPGARINQIAILRLDADLYSSTAICLKHFYPKLAPGGWCIVDDWNLEGCRKAVTDYLGSGLPPVYWQKPQ